MSSDWNDPAAPRIMKIVEDLIRRRHAGESIDFVDEMHKYPELQPQLEDALKLAGLVDRVIQRDRSAEILPGETILDRFRIVRALGAGGMGEIYQAYDLRLGQTVALKFLPERLTVDARARKMLEAEVRIARSIAHPNVCRVFDIHEHEGRYFLTMEYIDGEDLESLLTRSGKLPFPLTLELARQLLVGLAESHRLGVIHRDLKPSNIMVDGKGLIRITDFGLAMDGTAHTAIPRTAGTPGYMAPELARGEDATVQSDLYSVGRILYELFSGSRLATGLEGPASDALLEAPRLSDLMLHKVPASIRPMVDRCVQADPARRPVSAEALLAELPEADRADLLFGKPHNDQSPDMLAFVPDRKPVSFVTCVILFVAIVVALVLHAQYSAHFRFIENARLQRSPRQQTETARRLLVQLGHHLEHGAKTAIGFDYVSLERALRPAEAHRAVVFWYRQSSQNLVCREQLITRGVSTARVSQNSPAFTSPGDVRVELWGDGSLRSYQRIPGANSPLAARETLPRLFAAGGWQLARFRRTEDGGDLRGISTWKTTRNKDVTVTTTESDGKLLRWQVAYPLPEMGSRRPRIKHLDEAVLGVLLLCGIAAAVQNAKTGRGDRVGALRLGIFTSTMILLTWATVATHVADVGEEVSVWRYGLANACFWGIVTWAFYLALEPTIRRQRPERLIAWNRLLYGRWRDPLVGRDVLIGMLAAAAAVPCLCTVDLLVRDFLKLPARAGIPPIELHPLLGLRFLANVFAHAAANGIYHGFTMSLMPMLLQKVVRLRWLAWALSAFIITAFLTFEFGDDTRWFPMYMGLWSLVFLGTTIRFGLLSGSVLFFTFQVLLALPVTGDASRWYWPISTVGLATLMTLALAALVVTYPRSRRHAAKTYMASAAAASLSAE